jgi:heme ABC exporter ATP-binding subunit CcmA
MLDAHRVWRYFGDFPALRDVTFSAGPRDCVALLGANGAGKTTLLKLLARLAHPQKGTLELPPRERCGYVGHGLGLYDELSARENLNFWASVYGTAWPAVTEWLRRVSLDHVADSPVREFSRGMRQRVALGRAFLHKPDLLILDEPFTGLDQRSVELLQGLLKESLAGGAAIVISSHQIPEVMALATRTLRLERGQVMAEPQA